MYGLSEIKIYISLSFYFHFRKGLVLFCEPSVKNHKATKPAFNVGPSSAHQRNAILMAFHWWADDSPIKVVFGSSIPHQLKK